MDLNVSLSEFVRYILTGFNFLVFIVVLPLSYLQPSILKDLFSDASFLTIALLSMSVGYLLDILKAYQFSPKFKRNKVQFRKTIADTLEVPQDQASSYFSLVSKVWGKHSPYDLERRRSEWVLMLHTAITLLISIIVWSIIAISQFARSGIGAWLGVPILVIALSLFCALRLFRIADREREKSDRDFLLILGENKKKIMASWELGMEQDKKSSSDR